MNAAKLLKAFRLELRSWEGEAREVAWIKRGLEIGIRIIRAQAAEERKRSLLLRPRLSRWLAADLAHAIDLGLAYLDRSDRQRAIDTLKAAQEKVVAHRKS